MIRFACPGCGTAYTVADAKGGKAGKCRKCQVPFVIPLPPPPPVPPPLVVAPLPPPPPPPEPVSLVPPPPVLQVVDAIPVSLTPTTSTGLEAPPPPLAPAGVEIAPCPGCQARLTVDPTSLGDNVECPYCRTIFAAVRPGAVVPQLPTRFIEAEVVRPGEPERDGDWRSGRSSYRDGPPEKPAGGQVKKIVRTVGGTRTISRIGILSFAKMSGAISFVYSLIVALGYGAILLFIFLLGASAGADPAGLLGFGIYAVCMVVIMPLIYGVVGFIGGALFALIYNLLAQMIGGVEVDLE